MLTAANRPVTTSLIATPTFTGRPPSSSGCAGDRHQPADRLDDEVVAGLPGVGAGRAEPGDREVDEVRVELAGGRRRRSRAGEAAHPVVLDEDVRGADEPAEDLAARLAA